MEFILLIVAGIIVWHFIPKPGRAQPNPRFRVEPKAIASDPQWLRFIEQHCESPAEEAFLRLMTREFALSPQQGILAGQGLRLDFQVEEKPYRFDFLANQWLVLEIDGAAYHSSPEAIERDRIRDEFTESLGYTVLRIPAKIVFDQPQEAAKRVRDALQVGKRIMPAVEQQSGWQRLGQTIRSVPTAIAAMDELVSRAAAIQKAMLKPEMAFSSEKIAIDSALSMAKMRIKTSKMLAERDQKYVDQYHKAYAAIEVALAGSKPQGVAHAELKVCEFPNRPDVAQDCNFHNEIMAEFKSLCDKRLEYYRALRDDMKRDSAFAQEVEKNLKETGYSLYWRNICRAGAVNR